MPSVIVVAGIVTMAVALAARSGRVDVVVALLALHSAAARPIRPIVVDSGQTARGELELASRMRGWRLLPAGQIDV